MSLFDVYRDQNGSALRAVSGRFIRIGQSERRKQTHTKGTEVLVKLQIHSLN